MELLYSYIEFMHYTLYLVETFNIDPTGHDLKLTEFPSIIPISEIVENADSGMETDAAGREMQRAKAMANKLYLKYIEEECEFEINISHSSRGTLKKMLSDLPELLSADVTIEELLLLFEKSKQLQFQYMRHHLVNHKMTPEFEDVESIFAGVPSTAP